MNAQLGNESGDAKRERIARRAAQELKDGDYVYLGIGLATLVANYLPAGLSIVLQSENGMLGMGPFPLTGEENADLINAGKETITESPGASYFSSADSFGMIRGRWHPCVLHPNRRRYRGGIRQGNARIRQPYLLARKQSHSRFRPCKGVERRLRWQPRVSQDSAQLQSFNGHRCSNHNCRSRRACRAGCI